MRWTINHGCAGLEAWAGTPGTVGGGIYGNAHFGGRLIGDLVTEVRVAARDGAVSDVPRAAMGFAYDRSRLQQSGEILLSAVFRVSDGEPASAASDSARIAGVSKTHAAARHPERRLYLSEP